MTLRVINDRADKKRDDFLSAVKTLKEAMMTSLGQSLCEAAAASSAQGRLMYLSPRQLYEWVEGIFGLLTSSDVKALVSSLTTPLPKASQFPTHQATFVRNIRRIQRGQLRVAVGIIPNDHQLFSYLYETVYALPEFLQSLGLFSLNHPDIDSQTHVALSAFLTAQMPFILGQSGAGRYAANATHVPHASAPPPPPSIAPSPKSMPHNNAPTPKSMARKAKRDAKTRKAAMALAMEMTQPHQASSSGHYGWPNVASQPHHGLAMAYPVPPATL